MKRHECSQECGKSELDLFSMPPTQIVLNDAVFHTLSPVSASATGAFQFEIEGDSIHYLDLSHTELWVTVNMVVDKKVETLDADIKKIFPVNNLLHSLFNQIQVNINGKSVENSNGLYAYRAYLEDLLCFNKEAKSTFQNNQLYYKDDAAFFDSIDTDQPQKITKTGDELSLTIVEKKANSGAEARQNVFIERKNSVQLRGRLHSDIFNISKLILNNTNITVILTRSLPEFCYVSSTASAVFQLSDCFLKIRKVIVSDTTMLNHAMQLEKQTAKYPFKMVTLKQHNIPLNSNTFTITSVSKGVFPTRVVVAFVETNTYTGTRTKNPFKFDHFKITSIKLKAGSTGIPFADGIKMDPLNGNVIEGYNSIYQGLGEIPNDISYFDYLNGYCVFVFDLTPDMCHSEHFSIYKDGQLDLTVILGETKITALSAIIYSEYPNILEIDKSRNPKTLL
jgi:hypothetical protein